ncbi:hypothetical protein ABH931_004721 [Streptacidiphilus sp. MAP12-33]
MILGVAAAVLAAVCYNVGLLIEKRALGALPPLRLGAPVALFRSLFGRPAWLAGFALVLAGLVLQVVSQGLLPITVAQPLLAVGPAVLVAVSALVYREAPARADVAMLVLLALSTTLLVLSYDPHLDPVGRGDHPAAVLTVCAFAGLGAGVVMLPRGPRTGTAYGVAVGLLNGAGGLLAKALAVAARDGHRTVAALAALPYPWLLAAFSVLMLGVMQIGLQRSRAASLVPAQVITGNALVMVAGGVIFHEPLPADPLRLGLRLGALVVSLLVLALRPPAAPAPAPAFAPTGAAAVPGAVAAPVPGSTATPPAAPPGVPGRAPAAAPADGASASAASAAPAAVGGGPVQRLVDDGGEAVDGGVPAQPERAPAGRGAHGAAPGGVEGESGPG